MDVREVSSDTVLLVTSHQYADGDAVELTVRTATRSKTTAASSPLPPGPAFPERLTTYLEAEFPFVEPRARLTGAIDSPYQVTAAVGGSENRPVYVHTAASQNPVLDDEATPSGALGQPPQAVTDAPVGAASPRLT